jgi:hypothetical protein
MAIKVCPVCHTEFDHHSRATCSKPCRYALVSRKHKANGIKPPGSDPEASRRRITGSNAPWWKGGRAMTATGYVRVLAPADWPWPSMIDKQGRIREHRMVMAQHLGREILRGEVVHHANGDRADNRIENLHLHESHADHMRKCHGRG